VSVLVESSYGTKQLDALASGKTASITFSTRTADLVAGELTAKVTANEGGQQVTKSYTAAYPARGCG
jgi:hypothetical protein